MDSTMRRALKSYMEDSIKRIRTNLHASMTAFVLLISMLVILSYNSSDSKSINEYMYNSLFFILNGTVFAQHLVKDAVYKLGGIIYKQLTPDEEFLDVVSKHKSLKDNIPRDLESEYMRNYSAYKDVEENGRADEGDNKFLTKKKKYMSLILDIVELAQKNKDLINLPVNIHNVQEVIINLEELISHYGDVTSDKLNDYVIEPTYLREINEQTYIPAIFLVGRPGVGKTYFVNKYADIINAEVFMYKFSQSHNTNKVHNAFEDNIQEGSVYMKALMSSIKNPDKNIIIFIDEIDKLLLSKKGDTLLNELLYLFGDNTRHEIYDKMLSSKIPISRKTTFICASNMHIYELAAKNSKFKALESRFAEIYVKNMEDEMKFKLLREFISKELSGAFCTVTKSPTSAVDDKKEEDQFITDMIDISRDHYAGVRELMKHAIAYVNKLNIRELGHKRDLKFKKVPKTNKQIREDILKEITKDMEQKKNQEVLSLDSKNNDELINSDPCEDDYGDNDHDYGDED